MDSPIKSQNDNNLQTRSLNDVSLQDSLVIMSAQGVPRAKRMDPVDSREQPIVHRRVECVNSTYTTILEILTNNSKVLATAIRFMCRLSSEAPIEYFGMGIREKATRRVHLDKEVWKRLSKTEFFALTEGGKPGHEIIAMPYEVKNPGLKILCSSGILDDRVDLEATFSNIRDIFILIREHQNNLLLALKNDFLKILEIQVNGSGNVCGVQNSNSELLKKEILDLMNLFFQRCGFLETSLSKMVPTSLNSYLVYEMILVEYLTVTELFLTKLSGRQKFYCSEFVKTIAIELSYIFHMLEALKPFAFNAYEDLGYDKEDFNASDIEINGIYEKLIEMLIGQKLMEQEAVSRILSAGLKPCVSSKPRNRGKGDKGKTQNKKIHRRVEQQAPEPKKKVGKEPQVQKVLLPLNPLPIETPEQLEAKNQEDLKQKLLDESKKKQEELRRQWEAARAKEAVVRPKKPEQPDWNETKKRQERERIERKAAEAKEIVSDFKESVEAAEQKKLAERIAATKVFYTLPSRKQFNLIYEALSNDHKSTFDALYTAESFSITPDKIHQLAEKIAILMIGMGIDPATAKAFVTEVLNRNHPAHKSTDTGKDLSEGFIKKRCTSFIIFGLYPTDWQPSSLDEYKALKKCQQRRIDKKFQQF